jgi:hypothetical protein
LTSAARQRTVMSMVLEPEALRISAFNGFYGFAFMR